MILNQLSQVWIYVPVAILMVAGFALTLRSVDVSPVSFRGIGQVASNFSWTLALLGICIVGLALVQSVVGYNMHASW